MIVPRARPGRARPRTSRTVLATSRAPVAVTFGCAEPVGSNQPRDSARKMRSTPDKRAFRAHGAHNCGWHSGCFGHDCLRRRHETEPTEPRTLPGATNMTRTRFTLSLALAAL